MISYVIDTPGVFGFHGKLIGGGFILHKFFDIVVFKGDSGHIVKGVYLSAFIIKKNLQNSLFYIKIKQRLKKCYFRIKIS